LILIFLPSSPSSNYECYIENHENIHENTRRKYCRMVNWLTHFHHLPQRLAVIGTLGVMGAGLCIVPSTSFAASLPSFQTASPVIAHVASVNASRYSAGSDVFLANIKGLSAQAGVQTQSAQQQQPKANKGAKNAQSQAGSQQAQPTQAQSGQQSKANKGAKNAQSQAGSQQAQPTQAQAGQQSATKHQCTHKAKNAQAQTGTQQAQPVVAQPQPVQQQQPTKHQCASKAKSAQSQTGTQAGTPSSSQAGSQTTAF
jgi:hypothetical protein